LDTSKSFTVLKTKDQSMITFGKEFSVEDARKVEFDDDDD
jgi:hypothetical protein